MAHGDRTLEHISVSFNQDYTSLSVGTSHGYKLFSLANVENLEQLHSSDEQEDVALVERLFCSSLVAVVASPGSRKLKVCHYKKGTEITTSSFTHAIVGMKLNRLRLVICLEDTLYIHNIMDMKILHTIQDTPTNPKGILALTPTPEKGPANLLAYPGSSSMGEIQIFDVENLYAKVIIPAHNSPLAALSFNNNGTLLASASEKGTVVRVFSIADGSRVYELRRGMKRCATIYSLAFNADSSLLACSSSTKTIHVFKLDESTATSTSSAPANTTTTESSSWPTIVNQVVSTATTYLPSAMTDVFARGRSIATAQMSVEGVPSVVGLVTIEQQCRLLVASASGYLYVFNVDLERGECTLLRQHNLVRAQDPTAIVGSQANPPVGGMLENEPKAECAPSYAMIAKRNPVFSSITEDKLVEGERELFPQT